MTQTKRMAALASAFTLALLSGSAAVYASSKERIGIDNVNKCESTLRDPECTNDTAMSATEQDTQYRNFNNEDDDIGAGNPFDNPNVEEDAPRNRSDNLDDAVGLYDN